MKKRDGGGLPARLKQLRAERGISQYQLADQLGLSRGIIGNYEVGARQPDFATLRLFANFYGVSTDYLLGETGVRGRIVDDCRRDALVILAEQISTLSPDELEALEGALRCQEMMGEISRLSPDSLEDLRQYVELLSLRDCAPDRAVRNSILVG